MTCSCAAAGMTGGERVGGVRSRAGTAYTQSRVLRGRSGTVRMIDAHHALDKLESFSPAY